MAFVHLHLHTIYSFLDGLVKPQALFDELKKLGMNAVAITDHGNMHGAVDFYKTMLGSGGIYEDGPHKGEYKLVQDAAIKPVIGMEAYISAGDRTKHEKGDAFHLVLLSKNNTGYRNLCYMSSTSFNDGFYYKPRIDRALLKDHAEGLIALSACLGGEIPRALLGGMRDKAKKIALEYQELFGKENFYIELQVNGIREQEEVNPQLIELAREIGAPLVATNDVHYLIPKHAEAQDILFCINENKKVTDKDRMHHETAAFYLKSEEEMRRLFSVYGEAGEEAIDNTVKIAERCSVQLDLGHNYLPNFDTGDKTPADFLKDMAYKGLEERFIELGTPEEKKAEYWERLKYELSVIIKMDFPGYFLIVSDFIRWAKNNDIPVGPGRGSGAGSLVAYATRITDLDPLRYRLIFERFLNPERISMPDFDVDFCQDNRGRVIEYVSQKYGVQNVAQIATFSQLKAKSAVRDVGRAFGFQPSVTDALAKLVPDSFADMYSPQYLKATKDLTKRLVKDYQIPSEVAADPDEFRAALGRLTLSQEDIDAVKTTLLPAIDAYAKERKEIAENEQYAQIMNIAPAIEGLYRQPGKHACGLVIGQKPIYEYSPTFVDKGNNCVTQYDKTMVELVGLVKFDFLGLLTLTMIKHAVTLIQKREPDFDISRIPLDDRETYKMISEKSMRGIFQMESGGFEKMMHQMKPDRIEDLIAAVALYRPGPMDIIPNYISRKHGKEEIVYDHPWLADILGETFGLMVYQEQVMEISRKLAGFTMGEADGLRKAMGKKILAKMEAAKVKFIDGAEKKGIPKEKSSSIFALMQKFASYGFNKSHAACYGYISYQTAYLKCHYPIEFFTALISSEAGDANKVFSYINNAREMGISVYTPDINRSLFNFTVEENAIRFGFGAVKNVGEAAINEIVRERERGGDYKSLIDFASRLSSAKINSRVVEYLVKAGAFDFTGINRGYLLAMIEPALERGKQIAEDESGGQMSIFGFCDDDGGSESHGVTDQDLLQDVPIGAKLDYFDTLALEREAMGLYLSDHPARFFARDFRNLDVTSMTSIYEEVEETGCRYYGRRGQEIWVPGIVTGAEKPKKSKDGGDYYLRTSIESDEKTMDFTANKIKNPVNDPGLAKLSSKIPLIFKVGVRIVRNDEDDSFEKIVLSVDNLQNSVLSIDGYLAYMKKKKPDAVHLLNYECTAEEFEQHAGIVKEIIDQSGREEDSMALYFAVKITYDEKRSMYARLGRDIRISLNSYIRYKQILGADNLYLSMSGI